MIDMPIGLKWSGYRICDLRARELVGPAVFLGARRDLWTFADMAAANRHYWEREGKGRGVSAQLWNIRDKIRDVDAIMTPARQATIGEAHPEFGWAGPACKEDIGGGPRAAHRTPAAARLRALADMADSTTWHRHRDDLIDACACAIAARDSTQRFGGEETDPRGLRMEINY